MIYPLEVVERAANPVHGIPGVVDRYDLTLARVRKHMDAWAAERGNRLMVERRRATQLLPEPERDPERDKRISDGFAKLSDYLGRGSDAA
jgi:hypothetical protein